MSRISSRSLAVVGVGLTGLIVAAALSLPLFLMISKGVNWADPASLSTIYGAVATLASALALVGVAISIVMHRRAIRVQQVLSLQERHFDLVYAGIEHPDLIEALIPQGRYEKPRIIGYANLFVAHWASCWSLDAMTESGLRSLASDMFDNETPRSWWQRVGPYWSNLKSRKAERFVQILTEECSLAATRHDQSVS